MSIYLAILLITLSLMRFDSAQGDDKRRTFWNCKDFCNQNSPWALCIGAVEHICLYLLCYVKKILVKIV